MFATNDIFLCETSLYNEYVVSSVGTDGLALKHLGISSHSMDDACRVSWCLRVNGSSSLTKY